MATAVSSYLYQIGYTHRYMRPTRDVATALYYTGIDPFTKKPVHVAKNMRDRKMQPALMQFFKPENWFAVRGGKCCHRERLGDRPVYEVDREYKKSLEKYPNPKAVNLTDFGK